MELPLEGVRVIEVGQALAAPLAGAIMADLGADVIKVERPDGGDDARSWGPPFGPDGETSLYFHGQNRSKRGITLDLKKPEDLEALHRLCEEADILIQNLRPGVVEEMGIGPDAMRACHPRLIYCSIWAFGDRGPMKMRPGFDPLLQAYGGMMSVTGQPDGPPNFAGASINDKATGLFTVIGALAALRKREVTGQGCILDTSLFESAAFWVEGQINQYVATGQVQKRHGTGAAVIVPYQVFQTSDHPLVLAAGNNRLWARAAAVLGHPEWAEDPRFLRGADRVRNKAELIPLIAAEFAKRPRDEWIAALEAQGVPCSPVNDIGEVSESAQMAAMDLILPLPGEGPKVVGLPMSFDRRRPKPRRAAPRLGQHNREVLGRD
ncbi:CaiB/BaiF CoA transferase family protein [Sabulicella rubraurantiaca]|uniref:CaiB/BaiF CoA transferase family protein n=1 Tax=Sabulicella rubraurantiaca TaxID=2811429 RepID=UPI001A96DDD3|nr:CoA transferase [Sabulicella rubraurantiaca]